MERRDASIQGLIFLCELCALCGKNYLNSPILELFSVYLTHLILELVYVY